MNKSIVIATGHYRHHRCPIDETDQCQLRVEAIRITRKMPCLTNILPLHLPKSERRHIFEDKLLDLAGQWISADSEQKRERVKDKIEELRREVAKTNLLRRFDIKFIREVYEWQNMPYTDDYLKSFFQNYSDEPDDEESEDEDEHKLKLEV